MLFGISLSFRTPALIASSTSCERYAILSAYLQIKPSLVKGGSSYFQGCFSIPLIVSFVRFKGSMIESIFTEFSEWLQPPSSISFKTSSPVCPKGECPTSCPKQIASVKSGFRPKVFAIDLPI